MDERLENMKNRVRAESTAAGDGRRAGRASGV